MGDPRDKLDWDFAERVRQHGRSMGREEEAMVEWGYASWLKPPDACIATIQRTASDGPR